MSFRENFIQFLHLISVENAGEKWTTSELVWNWELHSRGTKGCLQRPWFRGRLERTSSCLFQSRVKTPVFDWVNFLTITRWGTQILRGAYRSICTRWSKLVVATTSSTTKSTILFSHSSNFNNLFQIFLFPMYISRFYFIQLHQNRRNLGNLFTPLWDDKGVILVKFMKRETTITAATCCKKVTKFRRSKIVGTEKCRRE